MLSEDFKEGYSDGYGQAVANLEAVLRKYVETHSTVIDFVEIREMMKKCEVDEDYLNQ